MAAVRERRARRCPTTPISVFDVDATEMADGLWQGGLGAKRGCLLEFYDLDEVVVLCPTDSDENDGQRVKVLAPDPTTMSLVDHKRDLLRKEELQKLASKLVRKIKDGKNVGIFCWQGRNRSGLLTAMVLRKLNGWSGLEAMEFIKSRRPDALDTESGAFEEYLADLGPPR